MVSPGIQAISNDQVIAGIGAKSRKTQTPVSSEEETGTIEERNPEPSCCEEEIFPGESEVLVARGEMTKNSLHQLPAFESATGETTVVYSNLKCIIVIP